MQKDIIYGTGAVSGNAEECSLGFKPLKRVAERIRVQATINHAPASDVDTLETEDFGGVAEESTTEFDNGLCDCAKVPDSGLLKTGHQFSESIVEVLFLVPSEIVRGAKV